MHPIDEINIHVLQDSQTKEKQVMITKNVCVSGSIRMTVATEVMFTDLTPEAVADGVRRAMTELEWGTDGWNVWSGNLKAQLVNAARGRIQLGIERPADMKLVADHDHWISQMHIKTEGE
jgi:hypothetical protein